MNLLIDIGNSRFKWLVYGGELVFKPVQAFENAAVTVELLTRAWQNLNEPKKVVISSVGSKRVAEITEQAVRQLWQTSVIIFVQSQAVAFGVTNAYRQPEKLGVDRWLAMIAAYRLHPQGYCVADCGTAITLDFVDAAGQHLGGLIGPGLHLMRESLVRGTENLDVPADDFPSNLANHTAAAIYNGTLTAAAGFIEHAYAINAPDLPLLMTGGDAALIQERLRIHAIHAPALVFQGLSMLS